MNNNNNDPNRPTVTGYPAAAPPPPNHNGYTQPPPGTAYPYAAPPPSSAGYYHNNNHPYYNQQQQQAQPYLTQRATFLRRVIAIAIASMVITGTFIFIVWLILRPKLPEFRIDTLSLTNLNLSNSLISANFELHFTVKNPNKKMTLYYDEIAAGVFYEYVSLSDTTVAPFYQEKRAETGQKASFATTGSYVNSRVFNDMNKERDRKGVIGFNVRMAARVRFKAGSWRARRRYVRVLCKGLDVGVGSNKSSGNLIGGSRQCRVGL